MKWAGCGTLGSSLIPENFRTAVLAHSSADVRSLGILLLSVLLLKEMSMQNLLANRLLLNDADKAGPVRCNDADEASRIKVSYARRHGVNLVVFRWTCAALCARLSTWV